MKVKIPDLSKRYSKHCPTSEDWCPTLPGALVKVDCIVNMADYANPGKLWHRVCAWGGDDLGMEKDFTHDQCEAARACYQDICALPEVNFDDLKARGFVWA